MPRFFFVAHCHRRLCACGKQRLKLMAALQKAKVPYEAHLFPSGGHGLSVCTRRQAAPTLTTPRWMELCLAWLGRTFGYTL